MAFLKIRPFVKRNNKEFTYVVSLHFLRATHTLTVLQDTSFSLPTTNNFFRFVYSQIHGESAWWVLFRPPWFCLLLWQLKVIRIGLLQFWTSDIQELPTLCRKFLYFTFLFVFSVLYTKNALKRAQFSRYSTTLFQSFFSFPQN